MNEQQQGNQNTSTGAKHEGCLCYEVVDFFRARLGVSPAVRQHLANSRVEFLKAVREVIDERIEHLSNESAKGTKISVE